MLCYILQKYIFNRGNFLNKIEREKNKITIFENVFTFDDRKPTLSPKSFPGNHCADSFGVFDPVRTIPEN